jgi:hypothetical protein
MSKSLRLVAVLFLCPSASLAQVEFGVDGGVEVESFAEGADNLTVVSFPSNQFRFGFWPSPTVGVELRTRETPRRPCSPWEAPCACA